MNFRSLTVKEFFDNPELKALVQKYAPSLLKYPIKLFNKKSCGEIFDLVVSKGLLPKDVAQKIEAETNAILKK